MYDMAEEEKRFTWKVVKVTLGVFSTVMAAAIIAIVTTASNVVFDVHDLKKQNIVIEQRITDTRKEMLREDAVMMEKIQSIEESNETMRKEWREDQKSILDKLEKLNDKISR